MSMNLTDIVHNICQCIWSMYSTNIVCVCVPILRVSVYQLCVSVYQYCACLCTNIECVGVPILRVSVYCTHNIGQCDFDVHFCTVLDYTFSLKNQERATDIEMSKIKIQKKSLSLCGISDSNVCCPFLWNLHTIRIRPTKSNPGKKSESHKR